MFPPASCLGTLPASFSLGHCPLAFPPPSLSRACPPPHKWPGSKQTSPLGPLVSLEEVTRITRHPRQSHETGAWQERYQFFTSHEKPLARQVCCHHVLQERVFRHQERVRASFGNKRQPLKYLWLSGKLLFCSLCCRWRDARSKLAAVPGTCGTRVLWRVPLRIRGPRAPAFPVPPRSCWSRPSCFPNRIALPSLAFLRLAHTSIHFPPPFRGPSEPWMSLCTPPPHPSVCEPEARRSSVQALMFGNSRDKVPLGEAPPGTLPAL